MPEIELEPFTRAEYEAIPCDGNRYEVIEGDLIMMAPAPKRRHQLVSRNLGFELLKYLESHSVGELYHAPFDVFFSDISVCQPDIIFVKNENAHRFTDKGLEGPQDVLVEILSESSRSMDRGVKKRMYAKHNVPEYWIVDPDKNTVEIFLLAKNPNQPTTTLSANDSLTSEFFPGLALPLAKVFG